MGETRKPDPDYRRLLTALRREGEPDRVPLVELHVDDPIKALFLGRGPDDDHLKWVIDFWYQAGYDYVEVCPGFGLPRESLPAADTGIHAVGERHWAKEEGNVLQTMEDVERYPWPKPNEVDYSALERAAKMLPEGMKIIPNTSGVFENTSWPMGLTSFCMALHDNPEVVEEIFRRVGELLVSIFEHLADMDEVIALWLGDDLGSNQATMVSPDLLRAYVFPWHKRLADIAHEHGMPFMLHSCGNLKAIAEDLVGYVGIDAWHSLPPNIYDMVELKREYGDRVCLIGNVDVDLLGRGTPERVRENVRYLLREVAPGGGYCLGSANSIPTYVPIENYRAMVEEARAKGAYPIALQL
ncbi:MAG: nucleoside 2-deoxyribosyltransferase [Armatimonadota bacterium]|nr:MAG: nucleoside 2-deoxyribosyltransferase [Armatimonadota bacterium]